MKIGKSVSLRTAIVVALLCSIFVGAAIAIILQTCGLSVGLSIG